MSGELNIDIVHDEVALEAYEHEQLNGHVVIAIRNTESINTAALTLPEVAALCQGLREWMARQGCDDSQIENVALLWREQHPIGEQA